MKVLVACEFTDTVRGAFDRAGHDAWSVDLLPSENPDNHKHYAGDLFDFWCEDFLGGFESFDLMIAHPPCTYLTNAANRWLYEDSAVGTAEERWVARDEAIAFFRQIQLMPIDKIAIENPRPHGYVTERVGMYSDIVHPGDFGHPEKKGICLWLKNLPPLMSTMIEQTREPKIHWMGPGVDRQKERSRFYDGIAEAMVQQWG